MSESELWQVAFGVVVAALLAIGMVAGAVYTLLHMFGWSGPVYALMALFGLFLATAAVKRWVI